MRVWASETLRAWTWAISALALAATSLVAAGPAGAAPRHHAAASHVAHAKAAHGRYRARRVRHVARRRHAVEAPPPAVKPDPRTPALADAGAHDGVVTLAAQEAEGTDARAAADIQSALAQSGVKVLPVLAEDSLATLRDLPNSPVVDLALARTDVLDAAKSTDAALPTQLGFIARLFDEEVCVLARAGVRSLSDLNGKKVGVDVAGSSDWVTGRAVFGKLGVHPQFVEEDADTALAALDRGDLDAVVVVDGKPAPILYSPRAAGVHLLPIPYEPALQDEYYPARLTHADYPSLVSGPPIDTIAVATLLVAPLQSDNPARNQRVAAFTDNFLTHFQALLAAGRHPKWRDVNLAADAPGWTRTPSARHWLDLAADEEEKRFNAFVASRSAPMPQTAAERDKLFQEFVKWNSTQAQ